MKQHLRRARFPTLRAYVASQPRTMTQREIAQTLGLSPVVLSLYIHGHRRPKHDTALRLSRDFGIDLRGLLDPKEAA